MAGAGHLGLPRGGAVEEPGGQAAVLDDIAGLAGNAFHIEPARAEATPAQRIVDDANAGRKDHLAELVFQEGRAARHGVAVDGRGEVADQRRNRKSVLSGVSVTVRVDLGGRRILKKKNNTKKYI